MVLGIRSKSRKSVSVQVHFVIHVQEIKPWLPSKSLKSAQSVMLQWENGDQNYGSFASSAEDGKLEFNETLRFSALLQRGSSKKGRNRDGFHKNLLEFYLYDIHNGKSAKSQLLGSATINLADYGIIKETTAVSTPVNFKKSSKNSAQPFLYLSVQPFDIESSCSSPKSSLSKEMSIDKEESESPPLSPNYENAEDLEIASFTDDESEDVSSISSQTVQSASEITGDSTGIGIGGTKGLNREFILPLETASTSSLVKAEAESIKQLNGIKSPMSSTVVSSDMGKNAMNDSLSVPQSHEESVNDSYSNYKIPEGIHQSSRKNFTRDVEDKIISSTSYTPVNVPSNVGNSFQSQMIREVSWRGQRFNKDGLEKVISSSNAGILEGKEEKEQKEKGEEDKISMSNKLVEEVVQEVVLNLLEDDSIRKGKLKIVTLPLSRESHEQPTSILNIDDKTEDGKSHKLPLDSAENNRLFSRNQAKNLGGENNALKDSHKGAVWRGQRFNKDGQEKVSGSSSAGILEGKEENEQEEKGEEDKISMSNKLVQKVVLNLSEDDSIRKGKLKSVTVPSSRELLEQPTSILNMGDKTEDGKSHKLPLDTAGNNRLFSRNQAIDMGEESSALKDSHKGAVCHAGPGIHDSFLNNTAEMKSEVEMLQEELREAAALEVSLYSVVADHGSSANKVHTPARRLSRFYFHAYKVGSPATRASAAQSAVSGFVLVSKACGNDVPRLTFWLSNLIALRAILSEGVEELRPAEVPCISSECDGNGSVEGSTLKRSWPHNTEEKENTVNYSCKWEDPKFFLIALEKVEAWIFSRIVESVWWQTLTPHMQSAAAKSSGSKKIYGRKKSLGDQEQGNFSIDLWKRAFKDACERLCPLRCVGHECGCLPVIARLVMEQLINRLDVAMFNAILRESDEEMPTDPISDPISDSKVLPIPAGKSGFGAGVQLKNVIGSWSRWLSDLFVIDDSASAEDKNENGCKKSPECHTSFKPFHLLNGLSDLMMLPFEMLTDKSTRKEVCPRFGVALIRRVLYNFVPDEFCPGPIPDAVLEALDAEDLEDNDGSITSFPCMAASTLYSPPPAASVMAILQEVGGHLLLRSGSSVLKKAYTSDDELDELDSPFSAAAIDDLSVVSTATKGRDVVRYKLLRQVWKNSE